MVTWWWQWLLGYLVCKIKKGEREELINFLLQEGVEIWDLHEHPDTGTIVFCLSLADYRRILRKMKPLPFRIQILDKRGLPFYLLQAQKRKWFWAGSLLFVLLLYVFSQMIWQVEVIGNEIIPEEELLQVAGQLGLKRGVFRQRLPGNEQMQSELLSRFEQLSWAGVEIKGTKAVIRVVESKHPEERQLENPRHLVAAKSAVVKEIFVEKGKAMVTRNQRVKKGQILISGIMGYEAKPQIVSAKGTVKGLVWYETTVTIPLVQKQFRLTGETEKRTSLLIGNHAFTFFSKKPAFDHYKLEEHVRHWTLGPWKIPVGLYERIYYEKVPHTKTYSQKEALELAKERARKEILHQLDEKAEIFMEKVLQQDLDSGTLKVKLYYEVLEEIAKEQPILPGGSMSGKAPGE
ncbi:MAG: sporulation protein YqfD [Bacillus thermozeamaize]|uniref:Sporulation protein YqfD n=1 Tax=Bacillus thermozeamaize TaxID=230954 RepID=A0A1Y3PJC9_9BACI|nr:MAG: sporulation protein YqfD [Bacillus thermozeamaize]